MQEQIKKIGLLRYAEIVWLVLSMFIGSLYYEKHFNDNFVINLAIVLMVASPILINRVFIEVPTAALLKRSLIAAYVAICLFVGLDNINRRGEGEGLDLLLVLLLCGVALFILRRLSTERQRISEIATTGSVQTSRAALAGRLVFNTLFAPLLLGFVLAGAIWAVSKMGG